MEQEENDVLVKKAVNGDKEAFTVLYAQIYIEMFKFACFMIGNSYEAEDAVSDAVMDMYLGIHKLREPDKFKSWSFAILANKCRKKIRIMKNKAISYDDGLLEVFEGEKTDRDENMDVKTAYMELSGEERLIISYYVFAGYNSEEIGKRLHMNRNTVRTKISRAMTKMRMKMEVI